MTTVNPGPAGTGHGGYEEPFTDEDSLPVYRQLPRIEELGARHSWGVFPWADIGTLNLLTPSRVRAALKLVQTGEIINLSLPLDEPTPPLPGRSPYKHNIYAPGRNTLDETIEELATQGSSQWDGLRHIAAREYGWYGGLTRGDLDDESAPLGIHHFAEHGIVGRGVLVDAYTWLSEAGRLSRVTDPIAITPDDIERILDHEGCHLGFGDILLLRTHWLGAFRMADAAEREAIMKSGSWPGLYPGEEMAEFLWDNHIAAVVADNRAVEVAPGSPELGYLHRRLLSLLGIPLGELWELEKLTARCSMRKCYECLVVSVPLNLRGGVGSPSNAIAIL